MVGGSFRFCLGGWRARKLESFWKGPLLFGHLAPASCLLESSLSAPNLSEICIFISLLDAYHLHAIELLQWFLIDNILFYEINSLRSSPLER